jgi:HEAT repeat protein
MMDAAPDLLQALQARTSPARRSAAKRLRQLKDPASGPALLDALRREVRDRRTWENQYQMIMALGESVYEPGLPYLRELARRSFEATIIYVALGDAIVRIGRRYENDPTPVLDLMNTSNRMLINGAFRAVATLQLTLDQSTIEAIIDHVDRLDLCDDLRFWVIAAAAGWSGPVVERFLIASLMSPRKEMRIAALSSQQGQYRHLRTL